MDPIISWVFRFLLAALGFAAVWFIVPFLLGLAGLTWPSVIILLLAALVAVAILSHYWWGRGSIRNVP